MTYPMNESDSESQSSPYNALGAWLRQNHYQDLEQSKQRTMESRQYLEGLRQQDLYGQHMPQQPVRPDLNSRKTDFNVWDSMLAGANRFSAMQDAEYARRKAIEEQQTMQLLGQAKYLPGYEGVQGAEMPGWLGWLYGANPELGMKLGERVASPFAQQREVMKEVQTHAAKRQAQMEVNLKLAKQLGFLPIR
ncbi:hypothetical protein ACYX34_08585 [Nitrospira sp. CMX1]